MPRFETRRTDAIGVIQFYVIRHWQLVLLTLILSFIVSVTESLGIGLLIPLLQGFGEPSETASDTSWIGHLISSAFDGVSMDRRLGIVGAAIFAVVIAQSVLVFATKLCYGILDCRVSHEMRREMFSRLLRMDFARYEQTPSDQIFSTLAGETWRASAAITVLLDMLVSAAALVVFFCVLLLVDWQATCCVVVALIPLTCLVQVMHRWSHRLGRQATESNKKFTNRLLEGIVGNQLVRCLGREKHEQEKFERASWSVSKQFLWVGSVGKIVDPLYSFAAALLFAGLLWWMSGTPEGIGKVVVFVAILYRMQPRIRSLEEKRVQLASLLAPIEEVSHFLNLKEESTKGIAIKSSTPCIEFEDVWYKHLSGSDFTLKGVTFRIPSGKTTAIVGPSGSGKSTLMKLLMGLYACDRGRILIDGEPLSEIDLQSWRQRIAVVDQHVHLFNTSIEENIRYGKLSATTTEVRQAAEMADAHSFIMELPQGYQTLSGDRETRLSSGQKQRIALARAFIREPSLLILDEATSAVDQLSEQRINVAVGIFRQPCTRIIVSHRFSAIAGADEVVVLDRGSIAQQGPFKELLEQEGMLNQLYRS